MSKEKYLICFSEAKRIVLIMNDLNLYGFFRFYEASLPGEERRIIGKSVMHHLRWYDWLNMAEVELSALQRQCLKKYKRYPSINAC